MNEIHLKPYIHQEAYNHNATISMSVILGVLPALIVTYNESAKELITSKIHL